MPFNPNKAVERFARTLKEYGVARVTGDRYAGETFRAQFADAGITYAVAPAPKSQLYEGLEPLLNNGAVSACWTCRSSSSSCSDSSGGVAVSITSPASTTITRTLSQALRAWCHQARPMHRLRRSRGCVCRLAKMNPARHSRWPRTVALGRDGFRVVGERPQQAVGRWRDERRLHAGRRRSRPYGLGNDVSGGFSTADRTGESS